MNFKYRPYTSRLKAVDDKIRKLLHDKLPESMVYHNADHTLHPSDGVVAIAHKLAILENISEPSRELLITAAYLHDIGYIREYGKNEPVAARMAGRILGRCGYKRDEIIEIQKIILATDIDIEPKTNCEMIIRDADIDHWGREDFFEYDARAREELRAIGLKVNDDEKWFRTTLKYLRNYPYYTQSQMQLREKGKQKNIKALMKKLTDLKNR